MVDESTIGHPSVEEPNDLITIHTFHDLVLINDTEIFEEVANGEHIAEMERFHHERDDEMVRNRITADALSATPHSVGGLISSYYSGYFSILHSIWINVCGIIVTICTIGMIGHLFTPVCLTVPCMALSQLVGRLIRRIVV